MKLALSMLCENPRRKTGLTTLFHQFVSHGLELAPDVTWLLFAGTTQEWSIRDPRVEVVRDFPANDSLKRRLWADHFRVPAEARERGADVLLTVGFVPLRKCLPIAMQVFSLQHLCPGNRIGWGRELYRRLMTRWSWPKADLIITNSHHAASRILSVFPECRPRLVTSYEGLQHDQFHPAPGEGELEQLKARLGLAPGYFLWVSNFYPYKQADRLVQAYAQLDAKARERHPLVLVGGDWENVLSGLKTQVRQLALTEHVRFPGWVPDDWLAPLYRHALAFCLPSREETFGRCVIEAMACGTPCLINDIPIMREVAGDAAVIVDYQQPGQVAPALERLMTDTPWRAQLRERGLANARRFTFGKLTTERLEAIRRLLGHAAARHAQTA